MAHKKQPALFEDRFMESFAGNSIVNDQKIAVIELIANAWDAGATEVHISWPLNDGDDFSVSDNGHGMSEEEFNRRFRTLAYDRIREFGYYADNLNKEIYYCPIYIMEIDGYTVNRDVVLGFHY